MKYLNLLLLALMFGWIVLPGNNVVNTDKLISFSPYASRGVRCILLPLVLMKILILFAYMDTNNLLPADIMASGFTEGMNNINIKKN